MSKLKHTTTSGDGAIAPESTTPNTEGLTPYEQWKRQHGYKPDVEPCLEIGQRVKATPILESSDDYEYEDELDIPAGTQGVITRVKDGEYFVHFDNATMCWCYWESDSDIVDITPVGKSPSQIAAEKAEQDRLSQYRQLSLFDAQRGESDGAR